MPFLSVRILQSTATVPFIQFNAGQDQNVLCAEVVELNAVILQGDINDHLFEWEQIEGTPVTLNDAETLTPWFINPNTVDLVFRFWIDRGTPFERFSDVRIFRQLASTVNTSMTSTSNLPSHSALSVEARTTSDGRMVGSATSTLSSYADQDGTYIPVASIGQDGPYAIMWLLPQGITRFNIFQGVEVQRWDTMTTGWVVDGTQVPELTYYNIQPGVLYRLVFLWRDLLRNADTRETNGEVYNVPYSTRPEPVVATAVVNNTMTDSGATSMTAFSSFNPGLILLDDLESTIVTSMTTEGASAMTAFTAFIPSLIILDDLEGTVTTSMTSSGVENPNVTVFRVSGISIGS